MFPRSLARCSCTVKVCTWTRCWRVLVRVIYPAECDECDLSALLGSAPLRDGGCVWKVRNETAERACEMTSALERGGLSLMEAWLSAPRPRQHMRQGREMLRRGADLVALQLCGRLAFFEIPVLDARSLFVRQKRSKISAISPFPAFASRAG